MDVGLIGHGVIGKAVAANAAPSVDLLICDRAQKRTLTLDKVIGANPDLYIVAVGTPTGDEGACDTRDLASVLDALRDVDVPVIIHSTAPPSFYKSLDRSHFIHIPEFITERAAAAEYGNPRSLIVGATDFNFADMAVEKWVAGFSIAPHSPPKVFKTSPETAAFVKYVTNSMLALKVTYLNQCKQLADALGIQWSEAASLLRGDNRLGSSHWQVPGPDGKYGYGGMCFPKDVAALIAEASNLDVDFDILETAQAANLAFREQSP